MPLSFHSSQRGSVQRTAPSSVELVRPAYPGALWLPPDGTWAVLSTSLARPRPCRIMRSGQGVALVGRRIVEARGRRGAARRADACPRALRLRVTPALDAEPDLQTVFAPRSAAACVISSSSRWRRAAVGVPRRCHVVVEARALCRCVAVPPSKPARGPCMRVRARACARVCGQWTVGRDWCGGVGYARVRALLPCRRRSPRAMPLPCRRRRACVHVRVCVTAACRGTGLAALPLQRLNKPHFFLAQLFSWRKAGTMPSTLRQTNSTSAIRHMCVRRRRHFADSWPHTTASALDTPARPQTRYVMKYRHIDAKLELKVTNDRTVRQRTALREQTRLPESHISYVPRSVTSFSPTRLLT